MTMTGSIQVFQYEYPLGLGEISQALPQGLEMPYKKKNKRNSLEQVNLTATILKIQKINNSLRGKFTYQYQDVIDKNTPQEKSIFRTEIYDFLISPSKNCVIIGGAKEYRSHVSRLLSFAIHKEDERPSFKQITIKKSKMLELVMKIKSYDLANDVARPNFEFVDKKLQDLDDITYSQMGTCITKHKFFKQHYPIATYWSPKMRIRKCNGIVDEINEDKVALTLGKNAEFSIRENLNPDNWARFVLETCKSVEIF
jgi:hypothetical protein